VSAYKVTHKYVPPAGSIKAPGQHYTVVTDAPDAPSFCREITFYRTAAGREIATDGTGARLLEDGDLFREVKAAVARYEGEHAHGWNDIRSSAAHYGDLCDRR
jgi:hypothetical protein